MGSFGAAIFRGTLSLICGRICEIHDCTSFVVGGACICGAPGCFTWRRSHENCASIDIGNGGATIGWEAWGFYC